MAMVQGAELVDVIVDAGESAKSLNRPGMARLLSLVDAGAVDTVIIAKVDRLIRSGKDLAELLERFTRRGVSLVSVAESLDTGTAAGRLVLNIGGGRIAPGSGPGGARHPVPHPGTEGDGPPHAADCGRTAGKEGGAEEGPGIVRAEGGRTENRSREVTGGPARATEAGTRRRRRRKAMTARRPEWSRMAAEVGTTADVERWRDRMSRRLEEEEPGKVEA